MNTLEAQKIISTSRGEAIVVATMSAHFEWPLVSERPELDMLFSVMGKASSLGLGLALGRPDKKILVIDGDGSLLMNLGTLVTIAAAAPGNLIHLMLDNECYRCCPPSSDTPGSGKTDFAGFARASGYSSVHTFDSEHALREAMPEIMAEAGPVFVWVKCEKINTLPQANFVWPPLFVDKFVAALANA